MKKIITIALVAGTLSVNAQLTKLVDFAGTTNGSGPRGSLMQASDGMLYGMTGAGGTGGAGTYGVLFQYNPTTNTYTKKLDFTGTYTNGSQPQGSLMQASDGMLYGTTNAGGTNSYGVLFQWNPTTSTYTTKFSFDGATNGAYPKGSLMQASNGMLYGMTFNGGASSMGVLFQYNPSTSTYTKKLDFAGATNGSAPYGSLMQASDGMLYGMTSGGGASGNGVLFQYNPTTNILTNKLDFAGTTNGSSPQGSLMQASDGMLYGMTYNGGVGSCSPINGSGCGVLFQYNPSTSTYTKKLDFAGATNGSAPYGDLMQASDGMLYGMTSADGAGTYGVLFQYNPSTSTYTDKYDFVGVINGRNPWGSLIQATDGMLYGMTNAGGTSTVCTGGCGTLFKYGNGTMGIQQITNSNEVSIYPNPAKDVLNVEGLMLNGTNQITMYDMLGNSVYHATFTTQHNTISVADLAEGVYFINIKTEQGTTTKKIIINK